MDPRFICDWAIGSIQGGFTNKCNDIATKFIPREDHVLHLCPKHFLTFTGLYQTCNFEEAVILDVMQS
jgi:hypothetical protein